MKRLAGIVALFALLTIGAGSAHADALGSQFRVSILGPDGDPGQDARYADIAYNPQTNQHLIVYDGDNSQDSEVYGQFIDADGNRIGDGFVISEDSEDEGDPPAVTYNEEDNEFLVAWNAGSDVMVQRLSASGAELGDDTQIDDATTGGIETVDLRYGPAGDTYLVVWKGSGGDGSQLYGHRVNRDGTEAGEDLTLSEMADNANDAVALTYNPTEQEFFAVWRGEDTGSDYEIFGQRVNTDGSEDGPDVPISAMGGSDSDGLNAAGPRVTYNSARNEYLAAWIGDEQVNGAGVRGGGQGVDTDIFAQRLTASGSQVGADDFRVSETPAHDGTSQNRINRPDVAYNPSANEYLVAWAGVKVIDEGRDVYGQYLTTEGAEIGTNDFRISEMGPDPDSDYEGSRPTLAYNSRTCDYAATWQGDTNAGGLVEDEFEIWGRRVSAPPCPVAAQAPTPTPDTRAPRVSLAGVRRGRCVSRDFRLRVRITEGSALRSARVSLDGRRIVTTRRKRFTVVIRARRLRSGRHRIGVAAVDAAGNRRAVTTRFTRCARRAAAPNFTG